MKNSNSGENHSRQKSDSTQQKLHEIIFESETPAGQFFDVALIVSIILSIAVVMLESVAGIRKDYATILFYADWFFTVGFTVEYALRIYSSSRRLAYVASFYGVIDLLSFVPGYINLLVPGSRYLVAIRALRVLRVFRVLKLTQYLKEAEILFAAFKASRRKIAVFIFSVMTLVVFIGAVIYIIEGEENGFTSIPLSIYWAVVTLTTVGYGDISPQTSLGQAFSVLIMLLGYGIIAIPTGVFTVEMVNEAGKASSNRVCQNCYKEGHDSDAIYCKACGHALSKIIEN